MSAKSRKSVNLDQILRNLVNFVKILNQIFNFWANIALRVRSKIISLIFHNNRPFACNICPKKVFDFRFLCKIKNYVAIFFFSKIHYYDFKLILKLV